MSYSPRNPNGQATMTSSEPVVIASDQTAVPVSGTVTANLGTLNGAATSAKQDTGNTSLATIAGKDFATQTTLAAINTKLVSGTDIGDVTINNASGAAAVNIQDGGNSITVDGTVAATQSGSWAVAGNKTNNGAAPSTDNVGVLPAVSNASSPTFVEGNQTALSVNLSGNLRTSTNQIGGATISAGNGVSGTGVQRVTLASDSTGVIATVGAVTAITNALPAGTNAIGKLAANSGIDIGDVDVTSIIPGTGATNLGKAEDAAHASGDTGVMALGVRNDGAATSLTSANGDYNPIATDAQGTLYVVQKSPTATLANVASSATSVTILAANTARKGAMIYNDSTQVLYLKFGATASATSFTVPLATNTYYEVPGGYTGIIDGIWVSANGNARVTELT